MKNHLKNHEIGTTYGYKSLMGWVADHKYRNCANFNSESQVVILTKIAAIKDEGARNIALEIFNIARNSQESIEEMHKEFDTLSVALVKVSGAIDEDLKSAQ